MFAGSAAGFTAVARLLSENGAAAGNDRKRDLKRSAERLYLGCVTRPLHPEVSHAT